MANSLLVSTQGKPNPALKNYAIEADNPDDEVEWETSLPPLTYQDEVRERLQLLLFHLTAVERELNPTTSSQAKCLTRTTPKRMEQA